LNRIATREGGEVGAVVTWELGGCGAGLEVCIGVVVNVLSAKASFHLRLATSASTIAVTGISGCLAKNTLFPSIELWKQY
jgi:hypothetical protein